MGVGVGVCERERAMMDNITRGLTIFMNDTHSYSSNYVPFPPFTTPTPST